MGDPLMLGMLDIAGVRRESPSIGCTMIGEYYDGPGFLLQVTV